MEVCEAKQGQSTWLFTPPQSAAQIQQKVEFDSGSDKVKGGKEVGALCKEVIVMDHRK